MTKKKMHEGTNDSADTIGVAVLNKLLPDGFRRGESYVVLDPPGAAH